MKKILLIGIVFSSFSLCAMNQKEKQTSKVSDLVALCIRCIMCNNLITDPEKVEEDLPVECVQALKKAIVQKNIVPKVGLPIQKIKNVPSGITALQWLGVDTFALCAKSGKIGIRNIKKDEPITLLQDQNKRKDSLLLGINNLSQLVSAGQEPSVVLWNIVQNKCIGEYHDVEEYVCCMGKMKHPSQFILGQGNTTMSLYDTRTTGKMFDLVYNSQAVDLTAVLAVCYLPDINCIAAGYDDNKVRIWDLKTLQVCNTFDVVEHPSGICKLGSDKLLAMGLCGQDDFNIYNVKTGRVIAKKIRKRSGNVRHMYYLQDSSVLLASAHGTVELWDVKKNKRVALYQEYKDNVSAFDFNAQTRQLLTSTTNKNDILLWNLQPDFKHFESKALPNLMADIKKKGRDLRAQLYPNLNVFEAKPVQEDGL